VVASGQLCAPCIGGCIQPRQYGQALEAGCLKNFDVIAVLSASFINGSTGAAMTDLDQLNVCGTRKSKSDLKTKHVKSCGGMVPDWLRRAVVG